MLSSLFLSSSYSLVIWELLHVSGYPGCSSPNPLQFYFITFEMRDQILTQYSGCRCGRVLSCGIITLFFLFSLPSLLFPKKCMLFWLSLSTKVIFSLNYSLNPQNLVAGWQWSALRSSFYMLFFFMCNALHLLALNFICHLSAQSLSLIKPF